MEESITLSENGNMPVPGFGTWDLGGEVVKKSVETALDSGYTHIDTAEGYKNEAEIGEVLKNYDREELFLTSKVLAKNLNYENVINSCKQSLKKLNTSYLDLYLIHWPNPAISLRETLAAMKTLYEEGLIKNVGVSNFSIYQLKFALKISRVPLSVNQIEFHPWLYQKEMLKFSRENDMVITASAPLARTEVLQDKLIKELADKYDKSPAQIVLKWELAKNVVPLPKSTSESHIKQNIELFNWDLQEKDINKIDQISKNKRVYRIDVDDETYGISS